MTEAVPDPIEPDDEDLEPYTTELVQVMVSPAFILRRHGRVEQVVGGGQEVISAADFEEADFDLGVLLNRLATGAIREAVKARLNRQAEASGLDPRPRAQRRQEAREAAKQLAVVRRKES